MLAGATAPRSACIPGGEGGRVADGLLFWTSCAVIASYAGYPAPDGVGAAPARRRRRAVIRAPGVDRSRGRVKRRLSLVSTTCSLVVSTAAAIIVVPKIQSNAGRATLRGTIEAVTVRPAAKRRRSTPVCARRTDCLRRCRQAFLETRSSSSLPFRDPQVGAVTGELLLDGESPGRRIAVSDRRKLDGELRVRAYSECRRATDRRRSLDSTMADGVGLYWRYEKGIRRLESSVGSTLGATGAIYAMRRSLWMPLPVDTILDDVLAPMRAVLAGYRTVFNEKARAFDRIVPDAARKRAEGPHARRQLSDSATRTAIAPAVAKSRGCSRVSQNRLLVVPYALLTLMASSMAPPTARSCSRRRSAPVRFYLLAGYRRG